MPEEVKSVKLSRLDLKVREVASTDTTRSISNVRIKDDYIDATDGKVAVRKYMNAKLTGEILVSAVVLKKAAVDSPLKNDDVTVETGAVSYFDKTVNQIIKINTGETDGGYPNMDAILEKARAVKEGDKTICLDIDLLLKIRAVMGKGAQIRMKISGAQEAIYITPYSEVNGKFEAVLMPVR